jgi:hypothetical protein
LAPAGFRADIAQGLDERRVVEKQFQRGRFPPGRLVLLEEGDGHRGCGKEGVDAGQRRDQAEAVQPRELVIDMAHDAGDAALHPWVREESLQPGRSFAQREGARAKERVLFPSWPIQLAL